MSDELSAKSRVEEESDFNDKERNSSAKKIALQNSVKKNTLREKLLKNIQAKRIKITENSEAN